MRYAVTLARPALETATLAVEASSPEAAEALALRRAHAAAWSPADGAEDARHVYVDDVALEPAAAPDAFTPPASAADLAAEMVEALRLSQMALSDLAAARRKGYLPLAEAAVTAVLAKVQRMAS